MTNGTSRDRFAGRTGLGDRGGDTRGQYDRRAVIRRAMALGLAAPLVAAMLEAAPGRRAGRLPGRGAERASPSRSARPTT